MVINTRLMSLLIFWLVFRILYDRIFQPVSVVHTLEHWDKIVGPPQGVQDHGDVPPVYPNGWYKLLNSFELKAGEAKSIRALGNEFVVFRSNTDGTVALLDAYCPHLGANLGIGGRVEESNIVCPFHGWKFDKTGTCVDIPYCKTGAIPTSAKVNSYTVTETHNMILMWFDAEGREPFYSFESICPKMPSEFVYQGRLVHQMACHIAEIPENGADTVHLGTVHSPADWLLGPYSSMLGFSLHWTAKWEAEMEKKLSYTKLFVHGEIQWKGKTLSLSCNDSNIFQVGPSLVHLQVKFWGKLLLIQSVTPIDPFLQKMETVMFAEPTWYLPRFLCRGLLYGYEKMVEQDGLIWSRKRYISKPLLLKDDGPIGKFRRWYSQFYSEHSPTLKSINETLKTKQSLDW